MSKLKGLDTAIRNAVHDDTTVHLTTSCRAATRQILREFKGSDVRITLVMCRVGGGHAGDLLASGIVKKVIAGSYGALGSGYVGPMPQIQRAYAKGGIKFEHWSFL